MIREFEETTRISDEIKVILLNIEALETILMPNAIRYDIDKVQVSPVDNLPEVVMEIAELRDKVRVKQEELMVAVMAARRLISQITSAKVREVMSCRYLLCLTQEQSAVRVGVSLRHAQRLEDKGIEECERYAGIKNPKTSVVVYN